jgi:hypothetical protein
MIFSESDEGEEYLWDYPEEDWAACMPQTPQPPHPPQPANYCASCGGKFLGLKHEGLGWLCPSCAISGYTPPSKMAHPCVVKGCFATASYFSKDDARCKLCYADLLPSAQDEYIRGQAT